MEHYPVDQDLVLRNVQYGAHKLQSIDIYLPANRSIDRTKMIVYVHGGNWSAGDKDDIGLDENSVKLLQEYFPDFAFFNLNHRLAGDSSEIAIHAKDAEMDIAKAMRFIYQQANIYQISTDTYMAGLESGAQLASMYALQNTAASSSVKGTLIFSGALDLLTIHHAADEATRQALQTYIGDSAEEHISSYKIASPIEHISASSPPFLIIHDTNNMNFPVSQAEAFAKKLNTYNIDYEFIQYSSIKDSIPAHDMENTFNKIKIFLLR
ncbi:MULTISPECIES: alpha/beta hydrolase [Sphingobacterium]|uniref:Alpha/beta hydrolase fold domain-containing protein n=1 Tax=Sphingobacterium populi TaxID=1812824 RepID=A0ABW5U9S4_9SPHI|nr:alpha/beta hydrolase [Sphingobacterium sp. CFCC 11742]